MSGFKSFADPVEVEIEPGLTGIVGPNGCGKSNVVEALRWAMGESSAKGLRSSSMDDVIFNGNAHRPAFDLAEVSLKLHGPFDGVAAEFDEIQVSRRLNRQGGSHFRINGRETRSRDLSLIFADAGSGSRSPAIIGQGRIGALVDCKPAERRRLLEDQAGIGGLHDRRREAERKLEAAEQNLERLLDTVMLREQRFSELIKQAKQASRYVKLSKQIRTLEWQLALYHLLYADRELADARGHRSSLQERERETAQALVDIKTRIAGIKERLQDRRQDLPPLVSRSAALQAKLESSDEACQRLRQTSNDIAARLDQARCDLEREHADRASLIAASSADEREQASLEGERQILDHQKLETCRDIDRRTAEFAELEGRERSLSSDLAVLRARLDHLSADRDEAGRRLQTLHREQDQSDMIDSDRIEALEQRLRLIGDQIGAHDRQIEAAMQQRIALHQALDGALKAHDASRTDLEAARAERDRLNQAHLGWARLCKTNEQRRQQLTGKLDAAGADLDMARRRAATLECRALSQAAAAAEGKLQSLRERSRQIEGELERAATARRQCQTRHGELETAIARLEAETAVLRSSLPDIEPHPVADRMTSGDGHQKAVAAAFGEDMLASNDPAGGTHWRAFDYPSDWQPLPDGIVSLAACADPSDGLQRRLRQTGLVDEATARALQPRLLPGQQLVTEEGGLWRWDGFVKLPEHTDRLQQILKHRVRLATVEREHKAAIGDREALRPELNAADAQKQQIAAQITELQAALDAAREDASSKRRAADKALVEQQGLDKLGETLNAQIQSLNDELAALDDPKVEQQRLATSQRDIERISARYQEVLQKHHANEREKAELSARMSRIDAEIAQASENRKALSDERADKQSSLDAGLAALARTRTRSAAIEQETASLSARTGKLDASMVELKDQLTDIQRAHQDVAAAFATRREALETAQGANQTIQTRLQTITLRLQAIKTERTRNAERTLKIAEREASLAGRCAKLDGERFNNADRLEEAEAKLADLRHGDASRAEQELAALNADIADLDGQLQALDETRDGAEHDLTLIRQSLAVAEADLARTETLRARCKSDYDARIRNQDGDQERITGLAEEQTAFVSQDRLKTLEQEFERLHHSRERMGPVNLRAEAEAQELQAEIETSKRDEQEVRAAIDKLKSAISTLNREGRERLLSLFEEVDRHFRRLFQSLFGGGKAHLRLSNLDNPFEAGLELDAMPPGKKLQSLSLLSGGEKSLASLALIMALFLTRPGPLCVLDEVDAALDDVNVERFTNLLKEIAANSETRFLVITHHPHTMAVMDRLYGVTMQERGVSKLVSVELGQAVSMRESA